MIAALLLLACQTTATPEPAARSAVRSEWVYTLDLARARELGWGGPDSSDEDIQSVALGLLERRLRAIDAAFRVEPKRPAGVLVRSASPFDEARARGLDSLVRSIGLVEFGIVAVDALQDGKDHELPYVVSTLKRMVLVSERQPLDAWELENRLDEADDAERSAAPTAALAAYRSALSLWRGEPYASVPYADWAEAARTRLRRRFVTAAVRAAQLELAAGQLDRAQDTAERATRADPWSEPAYRVLVQADLALGDRAAARRALDACRSALAELGVAPEPATVALEQALFTPP